MNIFWEKMNRIISTAHRFAARKLSAPSDILVHITKAGEIIRWCHFSFRSNNFVVRNDLTGLSWNYQHKYWIRVSKITNVTISLNGYFQSQVCFEMFYFIYSVGKVPTDFITVATLVAACNGIVHATPENDISARGYLFTEGPFWLLLITATQYVIEC